VEVEDLVDKVGRRDSAAAVDGSADPPGFRLSLERRHIVGPARQLAGCEPIQRGANRDSDDQRPHDVLLGHALPFDWMAVDPEIGRSIGILRRCPR